ncbi:MAG: aminoglycoside phosphotransferase [Actinomycetia bacterium]|nr:aminoglycoside phosphotransferase [Actinomycetes bacterium]
MARVADPAGFASGLAGFLAALQAIDASDGPPAGAHNFFRGGPLATWDEQTRQLIRLAADDIDARAATGVWDTALASRREQAPVWVHGDVTASNLLVAGGELHAVIDFGCAAVGDPACDLVMEWEFFTGDSAEAFRRGLSLDEATWARGRGWALWKALVTIGEEKEGDGDAQAAARRFGWRRSPRDIIGLVIADHTRSAGR